MQEVVLGEMEHRFANIIWETAPVSSGTLVTLCAEQFSWKKSTTYTMLKRLCDKGLFENDAGTVKVLITKEGFSALQSESFVKKTFDGSLPKFVAAFTKRKRLSDTEIAELERLIAEHREEDRNG